MAINWGQILRGAGSMFPSVVGGAAGAGLLSNAYNRLGNIGETAFSGANALADLQMQQTQFRPFTVTSASGSSFNARPSMGAFTGGFSPNTNNISMAVPPGDAIKTLNIPGQGQISVNPNDPRLSGMSEQDMVNTILQSQQRGNEYSLNLSPTEQQFMDTLQGQANQLASQDPFGLSQTQQAGTQAFNLGNQFMQQVGQGTAQREQDVYNRIRAMQTPEEQRQSMALEERLANQGRLGVRTNMYGGTPEQLALEKAREEAQNQAALMAMQQGQAEQLQQANIGNIYSTLGSNMAGTGQGLLSGQQALSQGAIQGSYIPQAALLDALQPGLSSAAMAQQGQLTGAGLFGEATMGGLEALLGSGMGQANLIGSVGSGLLGGAGTSSNLANAGQGFMDFLSGLGIEF